MPNFGKLAQDLIGGSLRINDTLVIDQNLNLVIGNVLSSALSGPLSTPSLTEQQSMHGISVFGNLIIEPGWHLGGEILTTELIVNGPALCQQSLTVAGVLNSAMVTSETIMVDSILAHNEHDISIVGNLVLIDPLATFTGNILTSSISPKNANSTILVHGNIYFDECLTLAKTVDSSSMSPLNIIESNTSAGTLEIVVPPVITPSNRVLMTILNPCITATSVVLATIGNFTGIGTPIVQQITVSQGMAVISVFNIHASNSIAVNIPVQYLII